MPYLAYIITIWSRRGSNFCRSSRRLFRSQYIMLGVSSIHGSLWVLTTTSYFISFKRICNIFSAAYSVAHDIGIFGATNSRETWWLVTVVAVNWIIIVVILLEVLARATKNTVFIGCIYNLRKSSSNMSIYTALRRIRS